MDVLHSAPALTETVCPVAGPEILPFPVTLQAYPTIPAGAEYVNPVATGQEVEGPVIAQEGLGLTVTTAHPVMIGLHPLPVCVITHR